MLCRHISALYIPISSSGKLENNQASLTSQDTKVGAKAIYALESVSLKREEEEEGEGKKRWKHSGPEGTTVCVLASSETSLSLSCTPSTSLNSSATSKTWWGATGRDPGFSSTAQATASCSNPDINYGTRWALSFWFNVNSFSLDSFIIKQSTFLYSMRTYN